MLLTFRVWHAFEVKSEHSARSMSTGDLLSNHAAPDAASSIEDCQLADFWGLRRPVHFVGYLLCFSAGELNPSSGMSPGSRKRQIIHKLMSPNTHSIPSTSSSMVVL
jgi:hypothetical protein